MHHQNAPEPNPVPVPKHHEDTGLRSERKSQQQPLGDQAAGGREVDADAGGLEAAEQDRALAAEALHRVRALLRGAAPVEARERQPSAKQPLLYLEQVRQFLEDLSTVASYSIFSACLRPDSVPEPLSCMELEDFLAVDLV